MGPDENRYSILIIDDDHDLCHILSLVISDKCAVLVEHTLKNAEICLGNLKPAIVLLDNNLPDGSGVAFIQKLLALYPEVKIIMMTADTAKGLRESALIAGAVEFITKPFRVATISEMIFSLIPQLNVA